MHLDDHLVNNYIDHKLGSWMFFRMITKYRFFLHTWCRATSVNCSYLSDPTIREALVRISESKSITSDMGRLDIDQSIVHTFLHTVHLKVYKRNHPNQHVQSALHRTNYPHEAPHLCLRHRHIPPCLTVRQRDEGC